MDHEPPAPIAQPPSARERAGDRVFRALTFAFAWLTILVVLGLFTQIGQAAWPAVQKHGTSFLTGDKWDGKEQFGIRPQIWGTLFSSVLGLALGGSFGLAVAIMLSEGFLPPRLEMLSKNLIELLAAIPSV